MTNELREAGAEALVALTDLYTLIHDMGWSTPDNRYLSITRAARAQERLAAALAAPAPTDLHTAARAAVAAYYGDPGERATMDEAMARLRDAASTSPAAAAEQSYPAIDPLTGEANGPQCCGGREGCDVREYCARTDTRPNAAWIYRVIRDVAELPDRNSPEDFPAAMLVTADELRDILDRHVSGRLTALVKIGQAAIAVGWRDGDLEDFVRDRLLAAHPQPVAPAGQAAAGVQGEVAFWVLREQLEARETTCNGRMWFSDPVNSAWVPVFLRPAPAVERGVAEERALFEADWRRRHKLPMNTRRHDDGNYGDGWVAAEWNGWLARAALSTAGKEQA